jgi:hypothetical protein
MKYENIIMNIYLKLKKYMTYEKKNKNISIYIEL